jgi:tRNA/rRNA methyltransferase
MAAQIVAYEIFQAWGEASPSPAFDPAVPLATVAQMERLYAHLAQVMEEVGFRDRTQSGTHLMERIRRFMQRAELDQNESNILRGFLTCVQSRRRKAGE